MKSIYYLSICGILAFSCSKSNNSEPTLDPSDAAAVTALNQAEKEIKTAISGLISSTTQSQKHHWDSLYHHHDSLYWHHHSQYHHDNTHPHNDHQHQWVPYDPTVNHTGHYHPPYPGHSHDSLITVPNGHHPNATVHHSNIHTMHNHHVQDSVHHIHETHHH